MHFYFNALQHLFQSEIQIRKPKVNVTNGKINLVGKNMTQLQTKSLLN